MVIRVMFKFNKGVVIRPDIFNNKQVMELFRNSGTPVCKVCLNSKFPPTLHSTLEIQRFYNSRFYNKGKERCQPFHLFETFYKSIFHFSVKSLPSLFTSHEHIKLATMQVVRLVSGD
jgi:hypothetical protein